MLLNTIRWQPHFCGFLFLILLYHIFKFCKYLFDNYFVGAGLDQPEKVKISNVILLEAGEINTLDVISADYMIITEEAIKMIEEVLV